MIDITTLDTTLSRNGYFCLLDWLLEQNLIPYAAYEAWRRGECQYLDKDWLLRSEQLSELVANTEEQVRHLSLISEPQAYYQWGAERHKPLSICADARLHQALSERWQRPADVPQMDLFMDNSSAITESQLCADLAEQRFAEAQKTLGHLMAVDASHRLLGAYQDLVNYGVHMVDQSNIAPEALGPELEGLRLEVQPLALEVLGNKARDYLACAWRRLADNLAECAFDPARPELHKSFALAQIRDWQGQVAFLQAEPALFQYPILMARLAEAYDHVHSRGLSLLLWGLLCERFPQEGQALIEAQRGPWTELWQDFLEYDETWGGEVFLGYLFIRQPVLLRLLERVPEGPANSINQATAALVQARVAEQDERQGRARLKELCPVMLRYYMNKRDWYRSVR